MNYNREGLMEASEIISMLANKWEPAGDKYYHAIREYNDKLEDYHNMEKAIECPFHPPKCRTGDREKDIQLQREYEENTKKWYEEHPECHPSVLKRMLGEIELFRRAVLEPASDKYDKALDEFSDAIKGISDWDRRRVHTYLLPSLYR